MVWRCGGNDDRIVRTWSSHLHEFVLLGLFVVDPLDCHVERLHMEVVRIPRSLCTLTNSYKRTYKPADYHIVQEIQKFNIADYRPRQEYFRKAVHKVRMIQRLKRNRGYSFSQNESGQADLIRKYEYVYISGVRS